MTCKTFLRNIGHIFCYHTHLDVLSLCKIPKITPKPLQCTTWKVSNNALSSLSLNIYIYIYIYIHIYIKYIYIYDFIQQVVFVLPRLKNKSDHETYMGQEKVTLLLISSCYLLSGIYYKLIKGHSIETCVTDYILSEFVIIKIPPL